MWSNDMILVQAATVKKGGGVNAILSLLQDLIAFQDKVGAAIEAQDMEENKTKLSDYETKLGEMYESLLDMARGGVRAIRQDAAPENTQDIPMMNDNTIQELP